MLAVVDGVGRRPVVGSIVESHIGSGRGPVADRNDERTGVMTGWTTGSRRRRRPSAWTRSTTTRKSGSLAAAGDVAHGVERKLTPIATFLLGVAVERRVEAGEDRATAFSSAMADLERAIDADHDT